ncbi:hypothetical protein Tco_0577006 [Tanacetum coccineum]
MHRYAVSSLMDMAYWMSEHEVLAQIRRIFLDGYDVLDVRINFFIFLRLCSRMRSKVIGDPDDFGCSCCGDGSCYGICDDDSAILLS